MKRSKRQENSIIIYFGFYLVLLIALVVYIFTSLYPRFIAIEELKDTTKDIQTEYERTVKKGINYSEFKVLTTQVELNSFQKELLNNVNAEFYTESFQNDTTDTYLNFLFQKNKELNNPEAKARFAEKENKIIKLLPIYSEIDIEGEENLLSDFKFINYIETLLSTFSIEYDNAIGITDLRILEEFSDSGTKSKLDTNIYYIPLTLNVTGTKYNLINFLYYLEHVGNINISENELEIHSQNNDPFLYRGSKIILKKDQNSIKNKSALDMYNIFENQVIDIKDISLSENFDKDEQRNSQSDSLVNRVKQYQGDDKMSISLELYFYVKGVQNIKIIDQIESYITYFNTTKKIILQQMGNKNNNARKQAVIKSLQSDVNEMSKDIKSLNISIAQQSGLNDSLMQVTKYSYILHDMHKKIGYNYYIENFLSDYKKLVSDTNLQANNKVLFEYVSSIKKSLVGLEKQTGETQESYENRLNNKQIFENIIQIEKNIALNK